MQVIDAFIRVLEQQVVLTGTLVSLAEKKYEHINDAQQVAMITQEEIELVEQLQEIDKERYNLFDVISPSLTMREWLERTNHPVLRKTFQELEENFSRLQSVTKTNQELIQESLDFVNFSLNLLVDDGPGTYEKKGQQSSNKTLFDRKV